MPAHETATITATPAPVLLQPNISNGHWQSVESAHTSGIYSKRPLSAAGA